MSDDRSPMTRRPKLEAGSWKLEAGYDRPAERVWLPSSSACSRAAGRSHRHERADGRPPHRSVIIMQRMPIGTPVHERTFPLCESLNYREWSGYYTVSAYESHHEHEYNAIRNAAALIDVSPLFKYMVTGPGRRAAGRSADHARRLEDGGRAGLLHAVVRRARQGDRRRHGVAAWRIRRSAGPRPIRACAGSGRTPRA